MTDPSMAGRITDLSRWSMLAVLVYAPWAFGCTRPWTIEVLTILLGIAIGLWLISLIAARKLPQVPVALAVCSVLLIGCGWWMVVNAKFAFDPTTWTFEQRAALVPSAPGSIDYHRSWSSVLLVTGLLGAMCLVCDMGCNARWRKRLVWTMAVTGASIALFGLLQRMLGAPSIFWQALDTGTTFFATYRYHSNAGAFLNLVWPLTVLGWVMAWRRQARPVWIALWGAAVLLCFCGLVVSGARAAGAIAVLLLVLWGGWIGRQVRRGRLPVPSKPTLVMGGTLLLLLVLAVAAMAGLDVSSRRWAKLTELFTASNPRLRVDYVCLVMIPEAGWFGFGPGTFRIAFPYFSHVIANAASGVWRYAHQDYLQTFIEWGYLGGVLWAVVLIGGLLRAARAVRQGEGEIPFRDRALQFALTTALASALMHALVDFPLQIASIQLYFLALLAMHWNQAQWAGSLTQGRTASPRMDDLPNAKCRMSNAI